MFCLLCQFGNTENHFDQSAYDSFSHHHKKMIELIPMIVLDFQCCNEYAKSGIIASKWHMLLHCNLTNGCLSFSHL